MATAQMVRDIMTTDPVCMLDSATVTEAAEQMRRRNIGDVLVTDRQGNLEGVLTDRDIVVRALAEHRQPDSTLLRDVVSEPAVTIRPDEPVSRAVQLMREHALRRLPVTENGHAVGIVSIGDLATERDPDSALADISQSPPNK
ncbi:CBS domain-containing protein [Catellatospora bangladeshensis]|uniref:Oxidoreductase n=1 Tax=Catellatospora bangladeshensis TaxID=310355 RepID=A0A8J3JAT1_9ACTN|nr:CBS domain-containing protein [Catellatospora bangladeshensis]GIF80796.1 oxidoreductase [Catellatospora bangladeshensis]